MEVTPALGYNLKFLINGIIHKDVGNDKLKGIIQSPSPHPPQNHIWGKVGPRCLKLRSRLM